MVLKRRRLGCDWAAELSKKGNRNTSLRMGGDRRVTLGKGGGWGGSWGMGRVGIGGDRSFLLCG